MRRLYVLFLFTLLSCFSEENADLGGNFTFIRYFNGGGNDRAVAIKETEDSGYIIMANSSYGDTTKIKLIKTDELGVKEWSYTYAPPKITGNTNILSYFGYGIDVLPDGGFVITGAYINAEAKSELLILKVPADGDNTNVNRKTIPNAKPTQGFQGKAITVSKDASNNQVYIVLANILNPDKEDMALGEIKSDLTPGWFQTYGAGEADLVNKLFINATGKVLWGGTVQHSGGTDMRFVRTELNRKNTDFDLPIGNPGSNERGNDICNFGFGYAMIGNTNELSAGGDLDIIFKLLAEDGSVVTSKTFEIKINDDPIPGNKRGNAITSTQDGGLLLACTVPSNAELKFGRGEEDIYLIKIYGNGDVIWEKSIGSTKAEQSVAVLQTSDGGYVILATSDFAGLSTIMLMKTDDKGNIQ